jgi:ubiquinone/menaquinone biosynthesis C-methylase UbiE
MDKPAVDMQHSVDYDTIAATYDRRYVHNDFSGVERVVTEFVGRLADGRVLEVGCGTGHWLRALRGRGVWLAGLDASMPMLARARAHDGGTALVHGRAEQLPWAERSFERVFCINALQHFRDQRAFIAEARRVLRPGGRLMTIGLDPHTGLDRWSIYDYFESAFETDRRRYSAASRIREWMYAADFVDCVTREAQHLPARLAARTAIEQGRLAKDATSQLALLTDEQYQRGMNRIHRDIESAEARGTSLFLGADLRLYATFGSAP